MSDVSKIAAAFAVGATIAAPAIAQAQQEDVVQRNVTVLERNRGEYEPLGIRAGAFLIHPSLSLAGTYDDNVFAEPNDEDDDFGLLIDPTVSIASDWSRHALNFTLGSNVAFYKDNTQNNYQDIFGVVDSRIDVTRDDTITLNLGAAREHQTRDSPDDVTAENDEDLTIVYAGDAGINYRHRFNRVFIAPAFDMNRLDYDSDDLQEDDRDRWRYSPSLRIGYQISPRFNVFTQGSYNWVRYDETPDSSGQNRDSDGYSVTVGTGIDITGILFGELQAGYRAQNYDDDELDDVQGLGAGGALTWNITQLTTIVLDLRADILETTVTFEDDTASSDFRKSAAIEVQHELRRNILLVADLGYDRDDFEGTSRTDDTFGVGVGASYLLNRNLSIDATYDFSHRSSDDNTEEYDRNVVRLGITARL